MIFKQKYFFHFSINKKKRKINHEISIIFRFRPKGCCSKSTNYHAENLLLLEISPRTKKQSDRYLMFCFPFLLVGRKMDQVSLLKNQRILPEKIRFYWKLALRTKKRTNRYLVIYFLFLLVGREVDEAFLLENQGISLEKIHFCWKLALRTTKSSNRYFMAIFHILLLVEKWMNDLYLKINEFCWIKSTSARNRLLGRKS